MADRPEALAAAVKEHVEHAARYNLMLEYISSLQLAAAAPTLLVGIVPEPLPT